ncbi:RusA family crossover junction endodeoxyribonuclease [Roseibacillus ishigakijimensis]|uniref:RusA family crossover junction endodeoxyribonuclease n=1 Tax=Roseibacillus ishigakijimensis TaxID=454146 RepID=A0A934RT94_9BACT|nr:RusA family crossover junction endodeoxyribonuclease [Roseibacillus ishigakijimensis]MBK1835033.1 RusA family crossover junction endodeoxyribonuclease [Roseibacillus ishigakijimensis]
MTIANEMKQVRFFLSLDPPTATAQQKGERVVPGKGGKHFVVHYKKQSLKDAEKLFKTLLLPFKPAKPIEGAVRVSCEWIFPWRKSERKTVRRAFSAIPKTTKPDAGNSNKLLIDCMTDLGFWGDDSQVFDESARKYWGEEPGIFIQIEHGGELGFVRKGGLF